MVSPTDFSRGLTFEEFEIGQKVLTPGRTVTEADVVGFAGLSGDYNSMHTDAVYAQSTVYGQRVVHGLLGLSIAVGLLVRTGVMEETVMAFREIENWKFSRPIFIGDTIHAEAEILEKKPFPRLNGGAVILNLKVVNQQGQVTMQGKLNALVQSQS